MDGLVLGKCLAPEAQQLSMLGDQDPPTELGPAYKKSCVSDADWLQLK